MSVPQPLALCQLVTNTLCSSPLNVSQGTQTQLSHNIPHPPQPLLPASSSVGIILFLFTHPQHLKETSLLPAFGQVFFAVIIPHESSSIESD